METQNMQEKLENAGKKAEQDKAERRARTVKGSHLSEAITAAVTESGLTTNDKTGFIQVVGASKGKKMYIAKKGGRVDLSGFSFEHPAIIQITEEEAKAKHLGKVRGQINFDATDDEVKDAVAKCIEVLKQPAPEETTSKKAVQKDAEAEKQTEQTEQVETAVAALETPAGE